MTRCNLRVSGSFASQGQKFYPLLQCARDWPSNRVVKETENKVGLMIFGLNSENRGTTMTDDSVIGGMPWFG